MKRLFIVVLLFGFLFLLLAPDSLALSGAEHANGFKRIFEGFDGKAVNELATMVNDAVDSKLERLIRERIPNLKIKIPQTFSISGIPYSSKGLQYNHRIFGHGWTFDAAIPEKVLKVLEESRPGCKTEIIKAWRDFVNELTGKAVRITGLPKNQAKVLVAILWDIHLLGDWVPGNKRIDLVLPPGEILKNIEKNLRILFKNRPHHAEYCIKFLRSVWNTAKKKVPQSSVQLINDALFKLPLGEMLKDAWGKFLKLEYTRTVSLKAPTTPPPTVSKIASSPVSVPGKSASLKSQMNPNGQNIRAKMASQTGKISSFSSKVVRWAGKAIPPALMGVTVATSYGDYLLGNGTLKQANWGAFASGVGLAVGESVGWLLEGYLGTGVVIGSIGIGVAVFVVAIAADGAVHYAYHLYDKKEADKRIRKLFEEHKKIPTIEKLIRYGDPQYN